MYPKVTKFRCRPFKNTAFRLIPLGGLSPDTFPIELMYKPSIPDNVTSWKIFDGDVQILEFLIAKDTFKDFAIDEVEHEKYMFDDNFPSNLIPKSIVNLEEFYDLQDKFKVNPNCKIIVLL